MGIGEIIGKELGYIKGYQGKIGKEQREYHGDIKGISKKWGQADKPIKIFAWV